MAYPKSEDFRRDVLRVLRKEKKAMSAYDIFKGMVGKTKESFADHNALRVKIWYHLKMLEKVGEVKFMGEEESNAPMKKKMYKAV